MEIVLFLKTIVIHQNHSIHWSIEFGQILESESALEFSLCARISEQSMLNDAVWIYLRNYGVGVLPEYN